MLKWIGTKQGAECVIGIPARDLSDQEVEQYGGEQALLTTGMYEKPKAERKTKPAVEAEKES